MGDKTKILRMKQVIDTYKLGNLVLSQLISNLRFLLNELSDSITNEWKQKFYEEWWTVEQFFAVGRDKGETDQVIASYAEVEQSIEAMYNMLVEY